MLRRRNQSVASEATIGEAGSDRRLRRGGRGWGPFSGAQLTVIVTAVVVMVMLPVGAFAVVSGSNAFVTDATSGKHAAVNTLGQLTVADGATTVATNFGTMTIDPLATVQLFTGVDGKSFRSVRVIMDETGASPSAQSVTIYSGSVPFVLDNFFMNTQDVSRVYDVPGYQMTMEVTNLSPNPATYVWRLYGRSN